MLSQRQNIRSASPEYTPEVDRILSLPKIKWEDHHYKIAIDEMNKRFALNRSVSLWPLQARALVESYAANGLFGSISVGGGKTLVSFLLPRIWGAKKPLLLIPAKLRAKTYRALQDLACNWRVASNLTVWSYESLSTDNKSSKSKLELLHPDVIICDEAQALRNMDAARWRKFQRFAQARYGQVRYAFLSGSIMKTRLLDYWHLITLSLMYGSPLPLTQNECAKWGNCVDARVDDFMRPHPGVLLDFAAPVKELEDDTTKARRGLKERLYATRGVVISVDDDLQTGLIINRVGVKIPKEVQKMILTLRDDKLTPNGEILDPADVLTLWRHVRELACGFFQRWDPPAPLKWLLIRREWKRFEYSILNAKVAGLDSPYMVQQAYASDPRWLKWQEIRDTFEPNSKPFWTSDHMRDLAVAWLQEHGQLVWVEHPIVGQRIAKAAGCRYYGSGDNDIELAKTGPAVASIAAHGEGKNLQTIWHRMLVVSAPPSGDTWEQMIGRLLRPGQIEDEVIVDVVLPTKETKKGFARAIKDEETVEKMIGGKRKLLRGTYTFEKERL